MFKLLYIVHFVGLSASLFFVFAFIYKKFSILCIKICIKKLFILYLPKRSLAALLVLAFGLALLGFGAAVLAFGLALLGLALLGLALLGLALLVLEV